MTETEKIGAVIVTAVKAATAPLHEEIGRLKALVATLEARAPVPGAKGVDGQPGDRGEIGPVGQIGPRGERGEKGDAQNGRDGKDGSCLVTGLGLPTFDGRSGDVYLDAASGDIYQCR